MQTHIIGVKELRTNLDHFIKQVAEGKSFTVVKRSKSVFKIVPVIQEGQWEEVVDFTKVKKGGIAIDELLKRL